MAFIDLKHVTYSYEWRNRPAVNNVTIQLDRGEKVALTGLNGSGKSTLALLILGLLKTSRGSITLEGRPVEDYSMVETGRKLGYVLQNPTPMLFMTSVYDEVAFGLRWKGLRGEKLDSLCRDTLNRFDLWPLRDRMPLALSEGQKQMVAICAVFALNPVYLILDEPTKSIDTFRKELLLKSLRDISNEGTGLMIISHDQEFTERLCEREIKMEDGKVIKDEAGC